MDSWISFVVDDEDLLLVMVNFLSLTTPLEFHQRTVHQATKLELLDLLKFIAGMEVEGFNFTAL